MKILKRSFDRYITFDPDVKTLQITLNDIRSKIHGLWPELIPDGKFGGQTDAAVRAFQIAANIKVDGEVGTQTWAALQKFASLSSIVNPVNVVTQISNGTVSGIAMQINGDTPPLSVLSMIETINREIISPFASYLDDVSNLAARQLEKLASHKVKESDVKMLMRAMFEKPDLKAMRDQIKKSIDNIAHGNTNVINYKNNKQVRNQMRQIAAAQRTNAQIKIFGDRIIQKDVAKQVFDKCIKELESVNFAKRIDKFINPKLPKLPKVKLTGGGILTVLSCSPLIIDIFRLLWAWANGKPTEDLAKKVVSGLIELVVGTLITVIVASIVAAVGLTGGVAILVVLAVVLIIGLILACFMPNLYDDLADYIYNGIAGLFHSPRYRIDTQALTSYV